MDISYFCCHRFLGDTQQNNIMADCEIMGDVIEIAQQLQACYICGRTFLPSPLHKHTRVCERNVNKRRKVFDSLKQRIEGTELALFQQHSFFRKNENLPHPPALVLVAPPEVKSNVTRNQSKWKEKHEELVQAIRAAKSNKHIGPRRSIGAVGTMGVTERCPTCDRQFGPKAYDRHVEWCKERTTRIVSSPVNNPARERLEARVKYRVPLPSKSRRSLTREKYSASLSQSSLVSRKSVCNLDKTIVSRSPSVQKLKKQSSSTPKPNFAPEPIVRSKTGVLDKAKRVSKEEYNPFIVAEKQLMELLECDDFKPFNSSNNTPSKKVKTLPENKVSNSVKNTKSIKKRASVIEPPDDFQDNTHLMQDNFEMIENFINDNYINDDDCKKSENKNIKSKQSTKHSNNNKSGTNELLSLNSILAERKYSDDMTSIDPNLINENDNLDIPDKLLVDNDSPASCNNDIDHYSAQYDKNISMLEPLVLAKTEISNMKRSISMQENQPLDDIDFEEFISSFEDDDTFPTLKNFLHGSKTDSNTPNKKNLKKSTHSLNSSFGKNASQKVDNKRQSLSPLKRTTSLSNPVVKARSMKTKQDIQDYLHVREQSGSKKMLEREKLKLVTNPMLLEEPYNQGPCEEFKKYNDGYKKDTHRQPSGDIEDNSSIEDNHSEVERKHITKFSGDSAYGSLNRKSPLQSRISNRHGQVYQIQHAAVERSPSSSGSEKSTPISSKLNAAKLTKFCHDCGTKYPLDAAKFCIECGMRRLVL